MKREKCRAKKGSLWNTLTDLKGATFVILKNHTSALIRQKRLSPTNNARREASQNKFVDKGVAPNRVKSFVEVDCSEIHSRVY